LHCFESTLNDSADDNLKKKASGYLQAIKKNLAKQSKKKLILIRRKMSNITEISRERIANIRAFLRVPILIKL